LRARRPLGARGDPRSHLASRLCRKIYTKNSGQDDARKKDTLTDHDKNDQRLPPCTEDSPRLTALLRPEELEALRSFAENHHWRISTAVRAILREKLFGEKMPF
jgi:hypothetical protein